MKKFLIFILLSILSMAQAIQTYSVTINLIPKIETDAIFLENVNSKLSAEFSCGERLVSTLTCRLPSGLYQLSVFGSDNFENFFPDVRRYITVDRDIVIQQKVVIGFKELPSLPADIVKIFDTLRITADAKAVSCSSSEKLRLCAVSHLPIDALQKILNSSQELRQTKPWESTSVVSPSVAVFETVSEDSYSIALSKYGGQSTFIYLFTW